MNERTLHLGFRMFAGFVAAVLTASISMLTMLSLSILQMKDIIELVAELLKTPTIIINLIILALISIIYFTVLAALPCFAFGTLIVFISHRSGKHSALFYAISGMIAGAALAYLIGIRITEAILFAMSGLASSLAYWIVSKH